MSKRWKISGASEPPVYDESELTEKIKHWYSLLENENFYTEVINDENSANEINDSQAAMIAIFALSAESNPTLLDEEISNIAFSEDVLFE